MPLYEYCCHSCGEFEARRSLAQYNAPMQCPHCEMVAVKIFSTPNINLNCGSFSTFARENSQQPRIEHRVAKDSSKPRYQSANKNSRPWMIYHEPH
ncbi:MAG: zinc ribbon domain-containing protein [Cyanobacteria bacterium J083]|nr:MAG: zinc ribbon domain-containing protein [Cyanobacteria bacterium J083]